MLDDLSEEGTLGAVPIPCLHATFCLWMKGVEWFNDIFAELQAAGVRIDGQSSSKALLLECKMQHLLSGVKHGMSVGCKFL